MKTIICLIFLTILFKFSLAIQSQASIMLLNPIPVKRVHALQKRLQEVKAELQEIKNQLSASEYYRFLQNSATDADKGPQTALTNDTKPTGPRGSNPYQNNIPKAEKVSLKKNGSETIQNTVAPANESNLSINSQPKGPNQDQSSESKGNSTNNTANDSQSTQQGRANKTAEPSGNTDVNNLGTPLESSSAKAEVMDNRTSGPRGSNPYLNEIPKLDVPLFRGNSTSAGNTTSDPVTRPSGPRGSNPYQNQIPTEEINMNSKNSTGSPTNSTQDGIDKTNDSRGSNSYVKESLGTELSETVNFPINGSTPTIGAEKSNPEAGNGHLAPTEKPLSKFTTIATTAQIISNSNVHYYDEVPVIVQALESTESKKFLE